MLRTFPMTKVEFSKTHPNIKRAFLLLYAASNGVFLTIQRADDKTWGLPGGKVEQGEAPEDAIYRTAKQQIDFEPEFIEELYKFEPVKDVGCVIYMAVTPNIFRPKINEESLSQKWCSLAKWPQPAHPEMHRIIDENRTGFNDHAKQMAARL